MFPICQLVRVECHMQMQFRNEIIHSFVIREFWNELNSNFRQTFWIVLDILKNDYRLKKDHACKWHEPPSQIEIPIIIQNGIEHGNSVHCLTGQRFSEPIVCIKSEPFFGCWAETNDVFVHCYFAIYHFSGPFQWLNARFSFICEAFQKCVTVRDR